MSGWKPGDVAMVSAYNRREEYRAYYDGKTWREYGADMFCVDEPMTLRPLAVIDSEGREVNRLVHLLGTHFRGGMADMREAFRALLNPPKPDEPQGAAALVEDDMGDWWARLSRGADGAVWHRIGHPETKANWRDLSVTRVLSEGVTP